MRGQNQLNGSGFDLTHDGNGSHQLAQAIKIIQEHGRDRRRVLACCAVEDLVKIVRFRITDIQFEKEAVELRFGKRVGALHLDRVLRGQHEERARHQVLLSRDGDMSFLHRFKEGALSLWRGPIDLVGEENIGEDRAGFETKPLRPVFVLNDEIGADDVGGHQVGRELNPGEP